MPSSQPLQANFRPPPVLAYISDLAGPETQTETENNTKITYWKSVEPNEDKLFKLLSNLRDSNDFNEHGQKTLDIIHFIYPSVIRPKLISSRYWKKGDFSSQFTNRFQTAFSSPAILTLSPGSVLCMNKSSSHTVGNINIQISPALMDNTVNGIISILAQRGITTVLSIGNGGGEVPTIPSPILSTTAIMVGAIRKDTPEKNVFDSNYGTAVTCYAETPVKTVLLKGKPFGESSAAMAIITGLVLKIQSHRLSQNKRYLLPHEIKSILSGADKVTVHLPNGSVTQVPLPTWEGILPKVNEIPSGPPIS